MIEDVKSFKKEIERKKLMSIRKPKEEKLLKVADYYQIWCLNEKSVCGKPSILLVEVELILISLGGF